MVRGGGSGLVAWPVFKTATEAPRVSPVGSIPTRSRHLLPIGVALLTLLAPVPLLGQDTTLVQPGLMVIEAGPAPDTLTYPKPPVTPMGAFFRSLAIPGWSQSLLNRRLTGGLFIAAEGLSLGMLLKTTLELNHFQRIDNVEMITSKKQQQQDWITVLAFNHLFAALEGFVGAHLWDFPEDLRIRAAPMPFGGVGASVRMALPFP
jgi:hypothetical protein